MAKIKIETVGKKIELAGEAIQAVEERLRELLCDIAPRELWIKSYDVASKTQLQQQLDRGSIELGDNIAKLDELLRVAMVCTEPSGGKDRP